LWRQDKLRGRTLAAPLLLPRFITLGDGTGLVHVLERTLGDGTGLVHVLERDGGAIAGRVPTDGSAIVSAPVAAAGLAVVQTTAGALYALRIE